MVDFASTIVAALIGSVIGSIGAVLTDHWLTGRGEKSHRRELLVSLAEAVIEHEGDLFRTSTYLEFRRRYEAENALEQQWLAQASKAIQSLPSDRMEAVLATLKTTAKGIAKKTGIDSSLVRDEPRVAS